jgi:hypothetical protein
MIKTSTLNFLINDYKVEESELIDLDFFFGKGNQDIYKLLDEICFEVDDRIIDQIWTRVYPST